MLIKDLYTYEITDHGVRDIEATININENSAVYDGHFPRRAITPGVCQVLMIKEIMEQVLDTTFLLSGARNIKFTAIHEPGKVKEIHAKISFVKEGNRIGVNGILHKGETVYLKFKGEFTEQS